MGGNNPYDGVTDFPLPLIHRDQRDEGSCPGD
jgi:hypothetical protein